MKKVYADPELTVVQFETEDIVMASFGGTDGIGGDRETEDI